MNYEGLKPFANKTFYLQLTNYEQEEKFIEDLKVLSGKVTKCLTKDVSYVVTNTNLVSNVSSNPSPLLSNRLLKMNPPSFSGVLTYMQTRGSSVVIQKFSEQTKSEKSQDASNILDFCNQWKIKIVSLSRVLAWIKMYGFSDPSKNAKENEEPCSENALKLRKPFIKIEDFENEYKPKYKHFNDWIYGVDPQLAYRVKRMHRLMESSKNSEDNNDQLRMLRCRKVNDNPYVLLTRTPGASVTHPSFTSRLPIAKRMVIPTKKDAVQHILSPSKENLCHKVAETHCVRKRKRRYCEVCEVHFMDLEEHLETESHVKFYSEPSNFHEVEEVIATLPLLEDFLKPLALNKRRR